jgi:hypothetical protein
MNEPQKKNVQMTLKNLSFVNKFKVSFVCIPEDVWSLHPEIFFPKNFELSAKFCGVCTWLQGRAIWIVSTPIKSELHNWENDWGSRLFKKWADKEDIVFPIVQGSYVRQHRELTLGGPWAEYAGQAVPKTPQTQD